MLIYNIFRFPSIKGGFHCSLADWERRNFQIWNSGKLIRTSNIKIYIQKTQTSTRTYIPKHPKKRWSENQNLHGGMLQNVNQNVKIYLSKHPKCWVERQNSQAKTSKTVDQNVKIYAPKNQTLIRTSKFTYKKTKRWSERQNLHTKKNKTLIKTSKNYIPKKQDIDPNVKIYIPKRHTKKQDVDPNVKIYIVTYQKNIPKNKTLIRTSKILHTEKTKRWSERQNLHTKRWSEHQNLRIKKNKTLIRTSKFTHQKKTKRWSERQNLRTKKNKTLSRTSKFTYQKKQNVDQNVKIYVPKKTEHSSLHSSLPILPSKTETPFYRRECLI